MKIYTSEITHFGRSLNILSQVVKFDSTGCTEVDDSFGKKMIDYSGWFTSERKINSENVKTPTLTVDSQLKDQEIEQLKEKIKTLESKKADILEKYKLLEIERQKSLDSISEVILERDKIKEDISNFEKVTKTEKELLEYKFELALLEKEELIDTCRKLEIPEEKFVNKRSKKTIIEIILKEAK